MTKQILLLILFLPLSFSCKNAVDAENQIRKPLKVLILGNSITYHSPDAELGWNGDWGMAATAADKDFESVLTKMLTDSGKYEVNLVARNIAVWERDFKQDLSQHPEVFSNDYDVVIIRLGENVDQEAPTFSDYENELNILINRVKGPKAKVIITGTVWNAPAKDGVHQKIAKANQYHYVSLLDFQNGAENYATGQFANQGVSAHPSDIGMASLAKILFEQITAIY
jgi:hypothetical protein